MVRSIDEIKKKWPYDVRKRIGAVNWEINQWIKDF